MGQPKSIPLGARAFRLPARQVRVELPQELVGKVGRGGVKTCEGQRAQPGELAFGQLAGGGDALIEQLLLIDYAVDEFPRLAVADAAHRGQFGVQRIVVAQGPHLIDQAGSEHLPETFGDPLMQAGAVGRIKRQIEQVIRGRRAAGRFGKQFGERATGQADEFERALDAMRVMRVDARRARRVERRQFGVQRRPAALRRLRFDRLPQDRVGRRQIGDAFEQHLVVEHRAADEERHLAARRDLGHHRLHVGQEAAGRIRLIGRDQVDQVVRITNQGGGVGLGGADVHVDEHLCRIDAHQFERKAFREGEGEVGFAGSGGPGEQHGGRQVRVVRVTFAARVHRFSVRAGTACRFR